MTKQHIIRGQVRSIGAQSVMSHCPNCDFSLTHRHGMPCEVLRCPRCAVNLVHGEKTINTQCNNE